MCQIMPRLLSESIYICASASPFSSPFTAILSRAVEYLFGSKRRRSYVGSQKVSCNGITRLVVAADTRSGAVDGSRRAGDVPVNLV